MMKRILHGMALLFLCPVLVTASFPIGVTATEVETAQDLATEDDTAEGYAAEVGRSDAKVPRVTLRVCNWEEYIDEGGWDEDAVISLESGDIIGENSLVEDFEEWYYETYGIEVRVEYSTFGTNEDLYNMLTLGDVYDVVCPSEYMIMKLMAEDKLVPLSDDFFDTEDPHNYYSRGVSPYIRDIFDSHEIDGQAWSKYAAGYMWGITGMVYNPEEVPQEAAESWRILDDPAYNRRITIKDNVRDSYFAAVGALKSDLLTSPAFTQAQDYKQRLEKEMNDTSPETIARVQTYLQEVKDNVYSFESDSGKADMITGKVVANYQWSGDAVYTMDQAQEDGFYLNFAVPKEATNIYFDGWVMLKNGVGEDAAKRHAAQAFINFLSRPDNVIRNMYYIGYTSVISGGEDDRIFSYLEWNYSADEETAEEACVDYPLDYFFADPSLEDEDRYTLTVPKEQLKRQLGAQYPSEEVITRSSIMVYFDEAQSRDINQMWIRVRCFNIHRIPVWIWPIAAIFLVFCSFLWVYRKRQK